MISEPTHPKFESAQGKNKPHVTFCMWTRVQAKEARILCGRVPRVRTVLCPMEGVEQLVCYTFNAQAFQIYWLATSKRYRREKNTFYQTCARIHFLRNVAKTTGCSKHIISSQLSKAFFHNYMWLGALLITISVNKKFNMLPSFPLNLNFLWELLLHISVSQ